jgi:4-amino-4-deoxy-L-arabinose transferase-like glycosyltransferase
MVFYVAKLGSFVVGDTVFGWRFFFVLIGVLSLFFSYRIVKMICGVNMALTVLSLLVFSQYHVGLSRLVGLEILQYFFVVLSVYCFFRGLTTAQNRWIYLTGISLGIGYWGRELVVLLMPVFFIFLLLTPRHRFWLKRKATYVSLVLMLLCMSPQIVWSIQNNFRNYTSEDDHVFSIGISLRGVYLYFAEAFAWLGERYMSSFDIQNISNIEHEGTLIIHDGKPLLLMDGDNEFPFEHWVLGVIIFAAILYYFINRGNKDELIRFSMLMFFCIFIITTVMGYHPRHLCSDHIWTTATLYPGVILSSYMLVDVGKKCKLYEFVIPIIIAYFAIHAVRFASLPENQFAVPKMDLCEYYMKRAEIYVGEGSEDKARDRCSRVLSWCPNSAYGKRAQEILDLLEK